jgi:hypothetical protein
MCVALPVLRSFHYVSADPDRHAFQSADEGPKSSTHPGVPLTPILLAPISMCQFWLTCSYFGCTEVHGSSEWQSYSESTKHEDWVSSFFCIVFLYTCRVTGAGHILPYEEGNSGSHAGSDHQPVASIARQYHPKLQLPHRTAAWPAGYHLG